MFDSVDAATTFWIKGKEFTLRNLLQDDDLADQLEGGALAIFRLAPQDYHRFHIPARGTIESIKPIDGTYYTGKYIYQIILCIYTDFYVQLIHVLLIMTWTCLLIITEV